MKATIAVLPGDGIGPEVTREAVKALEGVARRFGHTFTFVEGMIGGAAIDATGSPLPAGTVELCQNAQAVLLGAVGGPQWDDPSRSVRPEQGLLALRSTLGVFANLRPVSVPEALVHGSPFRPERVRGTDLVVVRELTGGIYFSPKATGGVGDDEFATDLCRYSVAEIARVARVAGHLARERRGVLTLVDKANVLETSRLWRRVVSGLMEAEFPDLEFRTMLVDACAMQLIRQPTSFDVILTENMFGDILTDEAAMLPGSIGLLPSASVGAPGKPGLFEPIHGSAPDIAGRGLANPYGAILSAALLLRHSLGLVEEARALETAVGTLWEEGVFTADLEHLARQVVRTSDVGTLTVQRLLGTPALVP
jgi:3-isopropylmalate dehydrogenase